MQVISAEFIKSAVKPSQYPPGILPEVAFAGRSNVGKSSLINVLVNRKRLVKTSATPGRTQLINFFQINGAVSFVDLPGYGYAKVPISVQKAWGPMTETFLSTRRSLIAVVFIMDIRRTPGSEEKNFLAWLDLFGLEKILVVTKADKLSKIRRKNRMGIIAAALEVKAERLILFSAKTRLGKDALWNAVDRLVCQPDGTNKTPFHR
jgi:GTP-binding protein